MILISHRGNTHGRNEATENQPETIDYAIGLGYRVEVDVWCIKTGMFLGHDGPLYPIDIKWLLKRKADLLIHCKNVDAIVHLAGTDLHYFWHEKDTLTLTSKGAIWAYPGKQPIRGSIAVMPEIFGDNITECSGICSNNIEQYRHGKKVQ